VLKLDPEFRINETTILPAVMIDRPAEVKAVQRRNNYRVRVPAEFELTARLWRIPERFHLKDKPPRAAELALILRDISVGGLGVTLLPQDGQPPKVLDGRARARGDQSGGGRGVDRRRPDVQPSRRRGPTAFAREFNSSNCRMDWKDAKSWTS
jgi:hypothetical protein